MKAIYPIMVSMLLILGAICESVAQERQICLCKYQHGTQLVPDEWWVSSSRASALPKWNPEKEPIPFPLDRAFKAAKEWIENRNAGIKISLERVEIFSIDPNDEKLRQVFAFKFKFKIERTVDQIVSIVLMDGTVLNPETNANEKGKGVSQ